MRSLHIETTQLLLLCLLLPCLLLHLLLLTMHITQLSALPLSTKASPLLHACMLAFNMQYSCPVDKGPCIHTAAV
jgi:hypothetical protein